MTRLVDIPEVAALDAPERTIRIAPEQNVPLTPRVARLVDTAGFRRLAGIRQLGLVPLVYPAAVHTRFEHSLGVYRQALLFLRQLRRDPRFAAAVEPREAELLVAAALLHDVGHWPYGHLIEDLSLPDVPSHEELAAERLDDAELAAALREDWGLRPEEVARLLAGETERRAERILASLLSGPIDIDKVDYLARDSLHAGVPYGRHFDHTRLLASLCLDEAGDGLAIDEKGKTAAEMLVFARYVMFSEVYWHHGVRAASAMLQRAFWELRGALDIGALYRSDDAGFVRRIRDAAGSAPVAPLVDGLFGPRRRLVKRVANFSSFEDREVYERVAHRPFAWVTALAAELAAEAGGGVAAEDVIVDAPPVEKEVEFRIAVRRRDGSYRPLEEVSPVVRALAREQLDAYVKRVRIFARDEAAGRLRALPDLRRRLLAAAERAGHRAPINGTGAAP